MTASTDIQKFSEPTAAKAASDSTAEAASRTSAFSIDQGDPLEPTVAALLDASERYAHSLYPPESVHMLDVGQLTAPHVRFLVARAQGGNAIGCGAVALDEAGWAELKRMFVAPTVRRGGVARTLLARLEREARMLGATCVRLETGVSQPEAISLYRSAGYIERGPFGSYAEDPLSVFMEKELGSSSNARGGGA